MFQVCSMCPEKATNQCLCSKQYFCEQHLLQHLRKGGSHNIIEASMQPDPDQRKKMAEELKSRLQAIENCKARIMTHTSFIISNIEELAIQATENLDDLAVKYHKLLSTTEFSASQLEEIGGIFTTDFHLNIETVVESFIKLEDYIKNFNLISINEASENQTAEQNKVLNSSILQESLNEIAQKIVHQSSWFNLGSFLEMHTDKTWSLSVTYDQQTIISGGDDRSIKLWSLETKEVTGYLEGHTKRVSSLTVSTDDQFIVSGSWDRTVRVWSLGQLREMFVLVGHTEKINCVAISADTRWIASGSDDASVCVWSFGKRKLYRKLTEHTSLVLVVLFTETSLFSGSSDKTLIEWNGEDFQKCGELNAPDKVYCLDISQDQSLIVLGFGNGMIKLWMKRILQVQFLGHTYQVNSVKFACQDKRIISASNDKTVRVWSIEKRCQLACFTTHSDWVNCLAPLGDDFFVSGSDDFSLIVWDAISLTLSSVFRSSPVDFASILFDENRLIYPCRNCVNVWDTKSNCLVLELKGHTDIVRCVAFYADFIVSGSQDKSVRVWSQTTGSENVVFLGHEDYVNAVAICGDIVVSGSDDSTVRLWSIELQKEVSVLSGHTDYVLAVALTSTGEMVISSSKDTTVRVWSVNRLELVFLLAGHTNSVNSVWVSKDNTYVFSGSEFEESVRVWEINYGDQVGVLKNLNEAEKWLESYPEMRRLAERSIA
jgi:WD40 repeat protein